jgi:putative ABC transport system permease protein
MGLFETIRTALRDLALHKFRSALATLGIIFAVASVLAMVSISDGARQETLSRIALLGVDNLIVRSVKPPKPAVAPAQQGQQQQFINDYGLKRRDIGHVRATYPHVRYAVGVKNTRKTVYAAGIARKLDLPVLATEPDYLRVTRSSIVRGRFIHPSDEQQKLNVCVVGVDAARKIFDWNEPLGANLRVGNDWYIVVGIIDNAASLRDAGGDDIRACVFIPLETSRMRYGDTTMEQDAGSFENNRIELDAIHLQLDDEEAVIPTARRLEHYLSSTHAKKDFALTVPLELMSQKAATQRIFAIVMASIAGISLLIGGIGVMNIMLANVSERRKEIGTRCALGARQIDIVRQFLIEAATLTTLGGFVGLGVGYALSRLVADYAQWPTLVSPVTVALSLSVSCVSGLLFGLWPAWQAARVNPIEALRSE